MAADERKPWHKQPGETAKAFHAFVHYRDLLPHERSRTRAYTEHQKICKSKNPPGSLHASPEWKDWSFKYSWRERADAHDAEIAERNRKQRLIEIDKMNVRHMSLSMALQNLVVDRLNQLTTPDPQTGKTPIVEMSPTQMAGLLDRAAVIERRARGEATSISETKTPTDGALPVDLSQLSDEELEEFQALLAKAQPK